MSKKSDFFSSLKAELLNSCQKCDHEGWTKLGPSLYDSTSPCDCLNRFKSYVEMDSAGINREYWDLDWKDWCGDQLVQSCVQDYILNLENAYKNGLGLVLHGGNGVGKTFLSTQILKAAIAKNYSTRFITMAEITALMRSKIDSVDDNDIYERCVKNSEFLCIDNAGSEYRPSGNYAPAEFDILARHRRRNLFPTIISTNLSHEEFVQIYGPSISSLFSASSKFINVLGSDFRLEQGNSFDRLLKS